VILRETDGSRLLPIWIGRPEAESIVMELNGFRRERPLTHDLCRSLIAAMGGTVRAVRITRVVKGTYFADIECVGPSGVVVVDARPSDAIAIALRCAAPIYAAPTLLTSVEDASDEAGSVTPLVPPPETELSSSQLQAYLAALRPEDFGKFTP